MNLCINQVLEWLPDNETAHIFRVLWIEQSGTDVVTIELLNSKALPRRHKVREIEENIAAGVVRILQVDPYASLQRPDETISALHRSRRDEAWKVIAPKRREWDSCFHSLRPRLM
jgi:putative transposase